MVFHEFLVIEPFVDDHVEHAQGQGRIGSGPQREPDIGPGRDAGEPGIHGDQLGAVVQATEKGSPL